MELKQYASIFVRWLWLIVLGGVVFAVVALVVSLNMQPVYRASATLLVSEAPNSNSSSYNDILTSERLARTYSELLTKQPVLEEVITRLGLSKTASSLANQIDVQLVRDTRLIVVNVEDPNPQVAADIANLVPQVFAEQNQVLQSQRYASARQSLEQQITDAQTKIADTEAALAALGPNAATEQSSEYNQLQLELSQARDTYSSLTKSYNDIRVDEAQSIDNVLVYEPARPPSQPARPQVLLYTGLAGVVGLGLALGVALLIEHLDDSLKSPEEAGELLGLPVLGVVIRLPSSREADKPITISEPRAPASEAFRALRTSIQFSSVDRPLRTLLVTSTGPSEGKSTLTANLAAVMAQSNRRVILVDCDLRRPTLHTVFGCTNKEGLTDLMLQPGSNPESMLQATDIPHLRLLTSGSPPPNPAELLGSERMKQLIEQLAALADIVLFDTPPLLPVTDAAVLANRMDGVALVVDAGRTRVGMARQAHAILKRVGANVIGLVINRVSPRSGYGYYYHHPAYEQSENGRKPKNSRFSFGRRSSRSQPPAKSGEASSTKLSSE
jgi:tyrosine-protein kinase